MTHITEYEHKINEKAISFFTRFSQINELIHSEDKSWIKKKVLLAKRYVFFNSNKKINQLILVQSLWDEYNFIS